MTRASTCITTRASMVLNGASTCITTRASTCITTRASTCHYTRARLLFKNMHPGWSDGAIWTHQNCPRGPPGGLEMAQKCHKTSIYGHKWLRWLQMDGYQWILVGSGWDTSRMVRWGHLDPLELPPGASTGVRNGQKIP